MDINSSDSPLGNQGSQEFGAIVSGAGGQGPSQGGKAAAPGQSTGPSGVPTKSAAQIDAEQAAAQGGGQQQQQGDGQQQTGQQGQQQQQTNTSQQTATTSGATQSQADIIKATADAIVAAQARGAASQQQGPGNGPQQKQLSAEEFNAKYKVARANEDLVKTILGQDPVKAAAALNAYGQNLVQQAILMSLDLADANVQKVRGEFEPHVKSWQAHQHSIAAEQAEKAFFTKHADLANERDLVMEIKDSFITKVSSGQIRFANQDEALNAVATAARNILQRIRGNGATGAGAPNGGTQGQQQQQGSTGQQQQASRQMSAASSAGRTGTGQAAAKSDGEHIFGAEWK